MRILYYSWKAVSTMPFLVHRKQEIATEKKVLFIFNSRSVIISFCAHRPNAESR